MKLIALLAVLLISCSGPDRASGNGPIVSLLPSLTETVCALGLANRLAGVSQYCRYPPEVVSKKTRVGDCVRPNLETILKLRPGVVLMGNMQEELEQRFKALGIRTCMFRQSSLEDIYASITTLGTLFGRERAADSLVRSIRTGLETVAARNRNDVPKRVLFVVGRNPGTLTNIFTVNRDGFLAQLLAAAGGQSIFSDIGRIWAKVSVEEIIRRDPEYIIETALMGNPDDACSAWRRLDNLTAVRKGRVYTLHEDFIFTPGPRVVRTAERISGILNGPGP
jgi:iron complex transport system substrate-binding protein